MAEQRGEWGVTANLHGCLFGGDANVKLDPKSKWVFANVKLDPKFQILKLVSKAKFSVQKVLFPSRKKEAISDWGGREGIGWYAPSHALSPLGSQLKLGGAAQHPSPPRLMPSLLRGTVCAPALSFPRGTPGAPNLPSSQDPCWHGGSFPTVVRTSSYRRCRQASARRW